MRFDNTAMIMNVRALRRILQRGDDVNKEISEVMQEITDDRDHSQEWKAGKLDQAREMRNNELRKLGEAAMPLIEEIDNQLTARRSSFDHRDGDFQTALRTLDAFGKSLPYDVNRSIAESLRGDVVGLKALKAAYQQRGISTDYLDSLIGPLDSLGVSEASTVSEFVSYATSDLASANEWRPAGIRAMLSKYESALGLDCSVNPVAAKLDSFIADPNTPQAMRQRAESWRNGYAEALADDDPRAMSMTENRLSAWSQGQTAPAQGVE